MRRNLPAVLAATYIVLMLAVAAAPGVFAWQDPYALNATSRLQPPSAAHFFGTDEVGRDVYARVVHGTRLTLSLSLFVVVLSLAVGSVVGSFSGVAPRWADELIMRTTDIFLAFPQFVMAMAIVAAFSRSMLNAMLALAAIWWAQYARIVRAQVLVTRQESWSGGHRAGPWAAGGAGPRDLPELPGAGHRARHARRQLRRADPVRAQLIGLGAEPPTAEWGAILTRSREYLIGYWWYPTFPGLAIFLTSLAFSFLGDAFRDALDPRSRKYV